MQSTLTFEKVNKLFFGGLMSLMHVAIIYGIIFLTLLTENIYALQLIGIIMLIILYIDTVYDDCPITLIEQHYLGSSFVDFSNKFTPINCEKREKREITLQWIFMVLLIIVIKIVIVLLKYSIKELGLFDNIIININ
jgi:hypothetical protein